MDVVDKGGRKGASSFDLQNEVVGDSTVTLENWVDEPTPDFYIRFLLSEPQKKALRGDLRALRPNSQSFLFI